MQLERMTTYYDHLFLLHICSFSIELPSHLCEGHMHDLIPPLKHSCLDERQTPDSVWVILSQRDSKLIDEENQFECCRLYTEKTQVDIGLKLLF